MRSHDSSFLISKMAYVTMLTVFLFLFFATVSEAENKQSTDKIIIHVPYKIHKHHHTHTKYKVITIPAPKKENTVIYLKEQIQPVIKEVPAAHTHVEITETEPKAVYQAPEMITSPHQQSAQSFLEPKDVYRAPEIITPPHQQSAQSFLESIVEQKPQNPIQKDQQQEYSTITDDQKPLETHLGQNSEGFIPNLTYKPVILPSHQNLIHDFSFKPVSLPPHHAFTPKFFIHPGIHHSYENFFPKFKYQPMLHFPQAHFNSPHNFKPLPDNPKVLLDSVADMSGQMYKTIPSGPRATSYKVKEEIQEGEGMQLVKHQPRPNAIRVPFMKSTRKGKMHIPLGTNYQMKNINMNPNNDYEYEHVGYLIIDGNSRRVVGKNFKDELRLFR